LWLWAKFFNPARWPAWSKARVSGFDRVNSYFLKNSKRRRFSKKKKKLNGLQPGFWPGFAESAGSWLMQFFHQPGLVPAPGRAGPGFKTLAAGEPHPQPQYQTTTKCCGGITVPPHPMYYELHITTVIHHAFLLLFFCIFFIFFQLSPFFFFFFVFLSKITFFFQLFSVFFFAFIFFSKIIFVDFTF